MGGGGGGEGLLYKAIFVKCYGLIVGVEIWVFFDVATTTG